MKVALVAVLALSALSLAAAADCTRYQCIAAGAMANFTGFGHNLMPVCEGASWLYVNGTSQEAWCITNPLTAGDTTCKPQGMGGWPVAPWHQCMRTNPGVDADATYAVYKQGYIGDSCSTNWECLPPRTCSSGKCVTSVAVGGSCASSATLVGGTPVCPLGSSCRGSTTRTCVADNVAEGADCSSAGCAAGLLCFKFKGTTTTMKCVKPLSQPLDVDTDGDFPACASGYANQSDSGSFCRPKPDVSALLGVACTETGDECGTSGLLQCSCTANSLISNTRKCARTDMDIELSTLQAYASVLGSAECEKIAEPSQFGKPGACEVGGVKSVMCANYRYHVAGTWNNIPCNMRNPVADYCNSAFSRMAAPLLAIAALVAVAFGAQW